MLRQFRLPVSLSVCHIRGLYHIEHIIDNISLSDRPIILVFRHQGLLRKSDAECKRSSDFQLICGYISETVTNR